MPNLSTGPVALFRCPCQCLSARIRQLGFLPNNTSVKPHPTRSITPRSTSSTSRWGLSIKYTRSKSAQSSRCPPMTSPGDAAPVKPPPSFSPGVARVASTSPSRYPGEHETTQSLDAELAESQTVSSPTPLSATVAELPIRSGSSHSRSGRSSTPQLARSSIGSPFDGRSDGSEDIRSSIIRSFSPTIAVHASEDTDDLVRNKGFKGGFWELIRPFGETVSGKVVIRDSIGSSRAWEDYGVRFADFKGIGRTPSNRDSGPLAQMEEVLAKQLDSSGGMLGASVRTKDVLGLPATTPLCKSFLQQLLCSAPTAPHETFGHPVANVIAISSRNAAPLETLRQLYADGTTGDKQPPDWVNQEYLRYYVLVHDEERDDITESIKLYDQMKRHFGLHCHLLRLRSSQCVVTDDDSMQVPQCEWLSPSEHLSGAGEAGKFVRHHTSRRKLIFLQKPWLTSGLTARHISLAPMLLRLGHSFEN